MTEYLFWLLLVVAALALLPQHWLIAYLVWMVLVLVLLALIRWELRRRG